MNFWIRNLIFGAVLAGLAIFMFTNQDMLFSLMAGSGEDTEEIEKIDVVDADPTEKETSDISNSAAEGLSRFYANVHGIEEGDGPRVKDGVVYLPDPNGDLQKSLEERGANVRPLRKTWVSETVSRPFRQGDTLLQKLSEYAEQEGIEVFWWLNRDLIVKDQFRIEKDIIATALLLGTAVEGHFPNGVKTYFCFNQRAIVLIEEPILFLEDQCALLPIENTSTRRY